MKNKKTRFYSPKNKYNGWTNYPTWKVSLEILGDINWIEGPCEPTIANLKKLIKEIVFKNEDKYGVANNYAREFLKEINYSEILQHINAEIKLESRARQGE